MNYYAGKAQPSTAETERHIDKGGVAPMASPRLCGGNAAHSFNAETGID